jgi:hypothetical protein
MYKHHAAGKNRLNVSSDGDETSTQEEEKGG